MDEKQQPSKSPPLTGPAQIIMSPMLATTEVFTSPGSSYKLESDLPPMTRTSTKNSIKAPVRWPFTGDYVKRITRTLSGSSSSSNKGVAEMPNVNGTAFSPPPSGVWPYGLPRRSFESPLARMKRSLKARRPWSGSRTMPPPSSSPHDINSTFQLQSHKAEPLPRSWTSRSMPEPETSPSTNPPLPTAPPKSPTKLNDQSSRANSNSPASSRSGYWDASGLPRPPFSPEVTASSRYAPPPAEESDKIDVTQPTHNRLSYASLNDLLETISNTDRNKDLWDDSEPPQYRLHHAEKRTASQNSTSTVLTRQDGGSASDGSSSTDEDEYMQRNNRYFPPRLPAEQTDQAIAIGSRRLATQKISHWVSGHEQNERLNGQRNDKGVFATQRKAWSDPSSLSSRSGTTEDHIQNSFEPELPDLADQREIEELWRRLKEGRNRMRETKIELAETREKLKSLRLNQSETDNAFMSIIRPLMFQQGSSFGGVLGKLEALMRQMQDARNEYNYLEAEYAAKEESLAVDEDDLEDTEIRFFNRLAAKESSDPARDGRSRDKRGDGDNALNLKAIPDELLGISSKDREDDIHPLYIRLVDAVGEYQLAKEEYGNMVLAEQQAQYDIDMVRKTGRRLPKHLEIFLDEFPAEKERHTQNYEETQREVEFLKTKCEEIGAIRQEFLSLEMRYLLYSDRSVQDIELDSTEVILEKPRKLEHHRLPHLLSQPNYIFQGLTATSALKKAVNMPKSLAGRDQLLQRTSKEYAIEKLITEPIDENGYDPINQWLLFSLRTSCINALVLCVTFELTVKLKIRNPQRFQYDVLHFWWKDETGRMATADKADHTIETLSNSDSELLIDRTLDVHIATIATNSDDMPSEPSTRQASTRRITNSTTISDRPVFASSFSTLLKA